MARHKKKKPVFDVHMGFSEAEVNGILKFHNIETTPFWEWMVGQTCPILEDGTCGYYYYDVHRYIMNKIHESPLIFD